MKTSLDHLPSPKRRELARVVEIVHEEIADAQALAGDRKRRDRLLKVVLFGSYAGDKWVDEKNVGKGYQSDYDILIVVSHDRLTDGSAWWYKAEDRMLYEPAIATPVNFIVHTLEKVNNALAEGHYFFSDIVREGIALYDLKGSSPFATPRSMTAERAFEIAEKHYDQLIVSAERALVNYQDDLDRAWMNDAAFMLHQAVERLYSCLLLVLTNYSPPTHNLKTLRRMAETLDQRLVEAWPRGRKPYDRYFELLRRAYVEARYSEDYEIGGEELDWLGDRVKALQTLTEQACQEHLDRLKAQAESP